MIFKCLVAALCLALPGLCSAAASGTSVTVTDDAGKQVTLVAPARRIISMAPHVTELLFAAGGGGRIVGAMNFSDFPPAAKKIPVVGSNAQIDMERVIALKPDLLIVWQSGNTGRQLEQLEKLGIPVFQSEPTRFEQVADSLTRFGTLLGTEKEAAASTAQFRAGIADLRRRYGKRPPVRVFYQIWDKPIFTLSSKHIINEAIALCGGENVFAGLKVLAPSVSLEAVLQANPEAIFGGDQHDPNDAGISIWTPYRSLLAVERGNLFRLDGELLTRPGPRIGQGVAQLCEKIELARQRRR